jgi:hypothetical protein
MYARDTRWPSMLMRWNWFETTHVHIRPLTPHVHITHELPTYHVHSTDNHLQNMERSRSMRVWMRSVSDSCVGCSWNTALHLLVCVDVRDISVIVSDTCAVHERFVSDFYPPTLRKIGQFLDAQTQSVHDL